MKILLVDDDDGLRSMVAKELEQRGCDVRQCSSGDEAFYVWQRLGPWELVLTDFLFFPDARIENGAQLVTAIHGLNPIQPMAIDDLQSTSSPKEPAKSFAPPYGASQTLPD
jgi:CheY-like chemotaxis protein